MPIPDFQTMMLPLLRHFGDGREYSTKQTHDAMARHFNLTEQEVKELLPSGTQPRFKNRIAWAKAHFKKAGLVEAPRRGVYRITQAGKELLQENPPRIDLPLLDRYPSHREFRSGNARGESPKEVSGGDDLTPEELMERGFLELREALAEELLGSILSSSPQFLEQLVVDLMLAMGYGGSREDAGHALGRSGDEGVDGVISEDRLGLDAIYLQAKRWQNPVGRPEVQAFAGALQGKKARKGIFITTSSFTSEARQFARSIESRIVLIDGKQLTDLMITHGVGVTAVETYPINKIDMDYFAEEAD